MLSQSFGDIGEEVANEADTVTTVEFDDDGQNLATGDRGGRIVVFKYAGQPKNLAQPRRDSIPSTSSVGDTHLWSPFFQFQSHDTEFDYLKSIEIEERVNQIRFFKPVSGKMFLLSTNDKTIKLWKVADRPQYIPEAANGVSQKNIKCAQDLPLPKPRSAKNDLGIANSTVAVPRRIYQHAHAYHINSLSINCDGETFLSADDLAVNLWNLDRSDCSYHIIDIKPTQMEELSEVVTSAQFHPTCCNLLAYTTSKGTINLCDLRLASLIDRHLPQPTRNRTSSTASTSSITSAPSPRNRSSSVSSMHHPAVRCYRPEEDPFKSNFSEILSSISNFKFSHDGRLMVTRDYMTVKVWDINMESKALVTIPVHDHLKGILPSLYESDAIFDKFEVFISPNADKIITGSYSNYFSIYNINGKLESTIQIPSRYSADTSSAVLVPPPIGSPGAGESMLSSSPNGVTNGLKNLRLNGTNRLGKPAEPVKIDQKILHGSWHPSHNVMAVAGQTGLYIYKI